ncbi:alcohol dehydrogenase-4 [Coleophoma crateriformis]|uniref:Alcohol dehydrogenase-4 n=1 Tax=Coleophoma crateriformis TaxID=565419 RepID=A0A3D8QHZ9_9HELO|nr:alcohol dehydrogenase-4 [Coleophoma crateriformis]
MSGVKHIVFVTGANTGLGYEIVRALSQSPKPYEIIVGCRTVSKGEDAIKKIQSETKDSLSSMSTQQIDIADDASIDKAFKDITEKYGKLDTLVNNAGGSFDNEVKPKGQMTLRESWNATYNLNTVSTHIVTSKFIPLLLASQEPRLLFITSGTSSLEETYNPKLPINPPVPAGWPKPESRKILGYRASKTGMNMVVRDWCRVLQNDPIKVLNISPGYLATGLAGEDNAAMGAIDPSIGGNFVKDVIEGKRDADAGKVMRKDMIQPW